MLPEVHSPALRVRSGHGESIAQPETLPIGPPGPAVFPRADPCVARRPRNVRVQRRKVGRRFVHRARDRITGTPPEDQRHARIPESRHVIERTPQRITIADKIWRSSALREHGLRLHVGRASRRRSLSLRAVAPKRSSQHHEYSRNADRGAKNRSRRRCIIDVRAPLDARAQCQAQASPDGFQSDLGRVTLRREHRP